MSGKTINKEKKAEIINKFAKKPSDTGSTEVQIALLTSRINEINGHFATHKKDFHSKQGLLKMIGKRKSLLNYLKKVDVAGYTKLISSLELRK
ncbi:MAG: 30S ribosomal protein S15 [Bdellovibrionota bacterium]